MSYVDGFVVAVPTANKDAYLQMAKTVDAVFKECGALSVVECWGDDVPEGKLTSFPLAVQRKVDETVVFSWIMWADRATRDEGMKKAMADARVQAAGSADTFDGKRMIFGGFQTILSL
ncbi:MAG: DUF1428 domain-containing protein [Burkholderiales bacterium]